jgi:hypothetical protein
MNVVLGLLRFGFLALLVLFVLYVILLIRKRMD